MVPAPSAQKRFPWLLEKGSRVPFEELVHVFEAGTFEEDCRDMLSLFDDFGLEVGCKFARSGMPSVANKLQDPVGWYRQEVRRIPEMDQASEMRFCMGLEFLWRRLRSARLEAGWPAEDIESFPGKDVFDSRLSGALLRRTREFVEVRNELIERNLHIVLILLRRYRNSGVPQEDLVQEANASLFNAIAGFDFTRGVRFKTYAGFWVHQAFLKAIYDQSRTVRVPAYIQKAMKRIRDRSGAIPEKESDCETISEAAGLSAEEVKKALKRNRYTFSLDRVADADEGFTFLELIAGADEASGVDLGERSALLQRLSETLGVLDSREKRVLEMRFGLSGGRVRTLSEVGEVLGVSLERVRQIQERALDRMRSSRGGRLLAQYA